MKAYEDHNLKNAEIPIVFHDQHTYLKEHGFGASNWHENFEILQVTEGSGIIISDSQYIHASYGDIVVINSNHLHAFSAESFRFSYRCLIIDRQFCIANGFDSNTTLFNNCFKDETISNALTELSAEWNLPASSPFRTLKIKSLLLKIMKTLCVEHSLSSDLSETNTRILSNTKKAIEYINNNYHQDISLDDMANYLGLNKYYFAHEFHEITGYTFVAYLNRIRCKIAKRHLATNQMSIADIARACGFNNKSYFAKTFQKYVGMLPNQYRQQELAQQKDYI